MELPEFEAHARTVVTWIAQYLRAIETYPVKSQATPGAVRAQIPAAAPEQSESFAAIMEDFNRIIMPGVTHWQHPLFCAYFPANASPPSVLAEMITAALGLQCMVWETSPAATELEQAMMQWLRDALGLPASFTGVIQDTASMSTLCALLVARERATDFSTNTEGLFEKPPLRVYCSSETHSSVEKAVRALGLGDRNLIKIAVDQNFRMRPDLLEDAIRRDLALGYTPMAVVATIGTTGCAAVDPIQQIADITARYRVWLHVDAAYAGAALLLPEQRWAAAGVDAADSFVMNCHKWLLVNFDCSALFVRDRASLQRTFEIHPEYLRTEQSGTVEDFRNFGLQLGRRFRALKLWMVFRSYGLEKIRTILRSHLALAREVSATMAGLPDFEVLAPCHFALVTFRYRPAGDFSAATLDQLNRTLLQRLNSSGQIYLTHTTLKGQYALRLSIGQAQVTRAHIQRALALIIDTARSAYSSST